jgi:hypothetical protein
MRFRWLVMVSFFGWFVTIVDGPTLAQQMPTPVLFFTDLTTGPASGNSDPTYSSDGGAYVTLYGNYFGASQGNSTVTLDGAACLKVVSWGTSWLWYQKIIVQLTPTCSSGNFVVTTNQGTSNGLMFSVRPGNIRYVSNTGSDSNPGAFSSPWKTIPKAVQAAGSKPGNIVYVENGVNQTSDDRQDWSAAVTLRAQWCQGTAAQPDALVVYPRASSAIGSVNGPNGGIRGTDSTGGGGSCQGNWTFAGFTLRGVYQAAGIAGGGATHVETPSQNWRFIGNDLSCPCPDCANSSVSTGCFQGMVSENVNWLGNNMHDVGPGSPTKSTTDQYHGVYFSTDSNHLWIAWNQISNIYGCRGFQTHSSTSSAFLRSGQNQYDIHIHDNIFHDISCDAIVLDTIDPSKGTVEVYNNVIWNAGMGPMTLDGGGNWSCIYVPGETKSDQLGSGDVNVYNNTLYNCGEFGGKNAPWPNAQAGVSNGGNDPKLNINMQNNIIYQISNGNSSFPEQYWVNPPKNPRGIHGTNNIMYGIGSPPRSGQVAGTITSNPGLMNPSASGCPKSCGTNLRPAGPNSAANGAGSSATPVPERDISGTARGSRPSIGAYECAKLP